MRQRRPRARASKVIKNRHLVAYMYAKQMGLLADGVLMDGTSGSVRAMLACVRDLTPVLEELLASGKPPKWGAGVRDLTGYRRRREVLAALMGQPLFDPRPPSRTA